MSRSNAPGQKPRRPRFALGFALGALSSLALTAGLAASFGVRVEVGEAQAHGLERKGFDEAVNAVLDRYVEPIEPGEVMARGLKHMVSGLDPHSHYLTADERKALEQRRQAGATAGLALHFERDAGGTRITVGAVVPGSAAEGAGVRAGDRLLEIDGRGVGDLLNQAEAEAALAGPPGSKVQVRVQRAHDPAPRDFALELRATPARPAVEGHLVDARAGSGKVAVLEIHGFRRGTGDAVKRELARLRQVGGDLGGIVIDLRGNPGGDVSEAPIVADLFVAGGVLTRTRGRGGRVLREEKAHPVGTDSSTPLVVLQDRYSASASELLSVALKEHGRARVVGQRSYGKGTVQEVVGLRDGSVLTFTVARYYSPQDHRIDGVGVAPDVPVATSGAGSDHALAVGLEALVGSG